MAMRDPQDRRYRKAVDAASGRLTLFAVIAIGIGVFVGVGGVVFGGAFLDARRSRIESGLVLCLALVGGVALWRYLKKPVEPG